MELRGQLGEDRPLVGTTVILLSGVPPIGFFDRQRAFYAEDSPLVDSNWLSGGGEDSSEIDNDE